MTDRHFARLRRPELGLGLSLGLTSGGRGAVSLDFSGGVLPSGVTFTRASTGSYVNSSGNIASAAIDAARFDYSASAIGTFNGLLIEAARTNLQANSASFAAGTYTVTQTTVTAAAATSPLGTTTGTKLTPSVASSTHTVLSAVTVVAATTYTYSVYVKAAGYGFAIIGQDSSGTGYYWVDLATGAITNVVGTMVSRSVVDAGNGWWRCVITYVAASTGAAGIIFVTNATPTVTFAGDGTSGIYVWGAQIEAGSTASTIVPTSGSQATRAADAATFSIPPGVSSIRYTFDDDSTQTVTVTPGAYNIPTNLNRTRIKRIASI